MPPTLPTRLPLVNPLPQNIRGESHAAYFCMHHYIYCCHLLTPLPASVTMTRMTTRATLIPSATVRRLVVIPAYSYSQVIMGGGGFTLRRGNSLGRVAFVVCTHRQRAVKQPRTCGGSPLDQSGISVRDVLMQVRVLPLLPISKLTTKEE